MLLFSEKGREQDLEMPQGNGVDNRHMQNNGAGAININVESASKKYEEESSEGWEVIRRRRRCCSLVRMHFGEIPSNILIHSNDATGFRERNNGWKREKGNRSYSAFKDQQQQNNRVKPAFKDQQRRGRENGYQSDRVKPAFNDQQRRQRQNGNRSDQVKAAEKSTERENRMRRRSNSGGSITSNGKPDIPVSKGYVCIWY